MDDEIYLSKAEFMKAFYVEREDQIYKWAAQGMPRKKIGREWVYPEKACRRWFAGEDVSV